MSSPDSHSHRGHKAPPRPPLPLEIPIYGPAPALVRAVVEGLSRALPADLRVGLVADPASAPALSVPLAGTSPEANRIRLYAPAWNSDSWRAALADCDLALTEGRPKPGHPGVLVLGETNPSSQGNPPVTLVASVPPGTPEVLACVASFARPDSLPPGIPVFSPDRVGDLASLILAYAGSRLAAAPLYGLVLGGGRSARMGFDKAALAYHGRPQTEYCLDLLRAHCGRVFLSCRADQAEQPGFAGLPQIHDSFQDLGPMSGILSALRAHPGAAFLVVACDLPYLDSAALAALVAGRDPFKIATAFRNPESAGKQSGLPEPLCAIYEPRAYARALQLLGQGLDCPRKLILNSSCAILPAPASRSLENANDPEAYRAAVKNLSA